MLPGLSCLRPRLVALALLVVCCSSIEAAARRVALVVGNADYVSLSRLPNTLNDVDAVVPVLADAGFEVFAGKNLGRLEFERLIERFLRASSGAEIALVYYSGHGVSVGQQNYLLPIDSNLSSAYDIEVETINLATVYAFLKANTAAQLLFLDACRDNPFKVEKFWIADKLQPVTGARGASGGLSGVASQVGSLFAFATAPGQVAYDGTGRLSPYTAAFVKNAPSANTEIRQVLTQVRRDVIAATGGQQVPWENSALVDDLYLVRVPAPPPVMPLLRVSAAAGSAPTALGLRLPRHEQGARLSIVLDDVPAQGRVMLDGRPLAVGSELAVDDLERLSFEPADLPVGSVVILAYRATDPWRQTSRGLVAITVRPAIDREAETRAREERVAKARKAAVGYVASLGAERRGLTIGVGPAPLGLPQPAEAETADQQLLVEEVPEAGRLQLGDRVLRPGHSLKLGEVSRLTYEPAIGTENSIRVATLRLADADVGRLRLSLAPEVDSCDTRAAAPLDLQAVTPGRLPNEIDAALALDACRRAVQRYPGVARFLYQLGRAQLAARQPREALASIQSASRRGHLRATWQLGAFEMEGAFGPANDARANTFFRQCADGGDSHCLYNLGKSVFYGRGADRDTAQGLELMIRSAEMGHTYAMNELGYIFSYGGGATQDVERGTRFYEAGAARNDIYSLNNLGLIHLRGIGRERDPVKALGYFRASAEGGHPYAPTNLGRMYRDGVGVTADRAQAAAWLERGAERGDYWGALDRGLLALDGGPGNARNAAASLALAVGLNRQGENFDQREQARRTLAGLPVAAKRDALADLRRSVGSQPAGKTLDDQLVDLARRDWQRRNPRYDLF